jgi:hypothetical protein
MSDREKVIPTFAFSPICSRVFTCAHWTGQNLPIRGDGFDCSRDPDSDAGKREIGATEFLGSMR